MESGSHAAYVPTVPGSRIRQNSGNLCTAHRPARSLGDFGYTAAALMAERQLSAARNAGQRTDASVASRKFVYPIGGRVGWAMPTNAGRR